jgi:uncharacterized membrane protein YfcA
VGIFSGMLGLGGGIIVVPALVFLCGFGQKAAQGTALAVMVPMALVGAIRYWRNPEVELRGTVIALLALGAIVGTLLGTELAARLSAATLRKLFAVFLIVVAVRMLVTPSRPEKTRGETPAVDLGGAGAVEHGGTDDAAAQR